MTEYFSSEYSLLNYIHKKTIDHKKSIILVAGNSRVGKTTVSYIIKNYCEENNNRVQYISLDDWILSIEKRKSNMNVYHRFQSDKLESDFEKLLNGEKIFINTYDYLSRKHNQEQKEVRMNAEGVIIIDGVISLGINVLRNNADIKIFVEADEEIRKKRFFEFYYMKGLDRAQITELYENRIIDEVRLVNETRNYAEVIVKFD